MMASTLTKIIFILLFLKIAAASGEEASFTFNGFSGANLTLDGVATVESNGLLKLTNAVRQTMGHAFVPTPLRFKSPLGKILSFSSTFVYAIVSQFTGVNGCGIAFVVSGTKNFSAALPNQYIGLFNKVNNGVPTNHVLAVELDTVLNPEFLDISGNHVGIDVNSLTSVSAKDAGYNDVSDGNSFKNLSLNSGQAMQVWVDYDGEAAKLNVSIAPIGTAKPKLPLLSSTVNLSSVFLDSMYVGFSSGDGSFFTTHCLLGWSFKINGTAEALDSTKLPPVPKFKTNSKSRKLAISLPLASSVFVLLVVSTAVFVAKRRLKYTELLEDWEKEYGPHRFSYKDLFVATHGFKDKGLLGIGGFGRVYRGVLPSSKIEVAVKRVSHDSRQGMKEFVAEIVSIGQLRHRNIVQLLGYCRRKGELLLVYDFMPNGSLDKYLHDETAAPSLAWTERFQIIKGVASGLLYLHEDWEQVVIHRDIKASNVLLDSEMKGRLGDFGLARLYEHGSAPQTTHVVGTMGYLAPELARTGKATTMTDVFAFGAFLLEVACGKRPIEPRGEQLVLVDWVLDNWKKGTVLATTDRRLGGDYSVAEMEMVLKLGLLCSHPMPAARPSMRQVMQFLDGDAAFPELSPAYLNFSILSLLETEGFDDYIMSFPSTVETMTAGSGRV